VSVGDTVRIMSLNDELLGEATIIAVSDALTSGLRAYDVRAEIEDASLRHGELVLVEVRTRDARITFSLPGPAVRWDIEGPHVFVLRDAEPNAHVKHRAELRRISVLGDQDGRVIALGDIKEGETVAFNGAFKLSDDSLVRIAGEERGQ
jgi:multidrug efflux pump subunit AcrA (membrane-fusion protein)